MLRLALLRHAKSSWEEDNIADHDRPLKERGIIDAKLMATVLKERELIPEKIISSTSNRTRSTLANMMGTLPIKGDMIDYDQTLYHAWADDILEFLKKNGQTKHLMLVGHNPGMHEFIERMTDTHLEKFPTCGFALLEVEIEAWDQIEYNKAALKEYLYPRMFR